MAKKKKPPRKPKFTIKIGDCVGLLKKLKPGSVDLAFADPPYGVNWKGYDVYDDSLTGAPYVAWCVKWMRELHKVLKKDGSFYLYISDEHVSELDVAAKALGFIKRSHIIHYYTFGVACSGNFSRSHTHLLYYTKLKTKFTFNSDDADLRVESARQIVYNDKRANPKGKLPDNTWILDPRTYDKAFTAEEDTWLAPRICGTFKERQHRGTHQKETTVPQMSRIVTDRVIRASSNPGDLVLDPFLGTGTTGESALSLGRDFWGCDLSGAYVKKCNERLKLAKQ